MILAENITLGNQICKFFKYVFVAIGNNNINFNKINNFKKNLPPKI